MASKTKPQAKAADSPLGPYLGKIAKAALLTAPQEQALAAEIASRRVGLWEDLLSYLPFASEIANVLEHEMLEREEKAIPRDLLENIRQSSIKYRRRETTVNRAAFRADHVALALAMAALDLDGNYSAKILAEALAVPTREQVHLKVPTPPRGSKPFANYLERIQRADRALRSSKNKFVKANLRLVVSIARRLDRGTMAIQDLVQEGNIGLMKAVDRFDGQRGYRFSTYASWWIRHSINRAVDNTARTIRLPAHVAADLQRMARITREVEAETGQKPTLVQLSEKAGLNIARVQRLSQLTVGTLSLSESSDDDKELLDKIEDPTLPNLDVELEVEIFSEHLNQMFEKLHPVELDILLSRFGIGEQDPEQDPETLPTLRELGKRHSLSRERIRQIQERALAKLRLEFARRSLVWDLSTG